MVKRKSMTRLRILSRTRKSKRNSKKVTMIRNMKHLRRQRRRRS